MVRATQHDGCLVEWVCPKLVTLQWVCLPAYHRHRSANMSATRVVTGRFESTQKAHLIGKLLLPTAGAVLKVWIVL